MDTICGALWQHQHYYSAMLLFSVYQVLYVMLHNLPIFFTLTIGNNWRPK